MFPVIVSEHWFPEKISGARRRDLAVLLSAAVLLAAGALAPNLLTGTGDLFKPLHDLTHGGGAFQCPLCGGTRAFVACCSLDFGRALGFNPFAVIVFLWTVVQIPVRSLVLIRYGDARARDFCDRLDGFGARFFLPLLFAFWVGRLVLLYCFPG